MIQPVSAELAAVPAGESPPRVMIVARDSASHEDLAARLRTWGAIVLPLDAASHDGLPELIVVERDGPAASATVQPDNGTARPGVIAIGNSTAVEADVTLPADFSPRELALACQLLTQVVRLRRQLDEGNQLGDAWRQQASCDPLTHLPNRRAWEEEVRRRLQAARDSNQPLCVALVDLDHFKQVNDGWGHAAGDQLLIATAEALRQSLRQDDFVARLGGDEFGLLLSGLDPAAAASVVERVRAALPARIAQSTPFLTSASVGFYTFEGTAELTPEQLLAHADRARRKAKTQGRDRAVTA